MIASFFLNQGPLKFKALSYFFFYFFCNIMAYFKIIYQNLPISLRGFILKIKYTKMYKKKSVINQRLHKALSVYMVNNHE